MKKIITAVIAVVGLSALLFINVSANSENHSSGNVGVTSLAKGQTHDGTLYGAGDSIIVNGLVKGDVFCAGQNVMISGVVEGDVICAAQTIHIDGNVAGDVRTAGQSVNVSGKVGGSLTTFGQSVFISNSAEIGQDLNGAGQSALVNGRVGRDVALAVQELSIDGAIGRDLSGAYDSVTAREGATIGGNAIFEANEATIPEGVVAGELNRTEPGQHASSTDESAAYAAFKIFHATSLLLIALVIVLLFPGHVRRAANVNGKQLMLSALIGLSVIVVTPIVATIIAVSFVGIPLAILLVLGWAIVLTLSLSVFSYYIGKLILRGRIKNSILIMLAGLLVVLLAINLPYVGALALIAGMSVGVGMVSLALARRWVKPTYRA